MAGWSPFTTCNVSFSIESMGSSGSGLSLANDEDSGDLAEGAKKGRLLLQKRIIWIHSTRGK
jgi:hypothetical protein